jgi:hypothetical protein
MTRRQTNTAADPAVREPEVSLSPGVQLLLSAVVALHVLAVFTFPFLFATGTAGEPSPAVRPLYTVLQPYIDLLYLNHGYFFFAPNPGPAHLVHYEAAFDDGREPIRGLFPDRREQWPRLYYHRHFMLSEFLSDAYRPDQFFPEPRPPVDDSRLARRIHQRQKEQWQREHAEWERRRKLYEDLRESIAEHLQHRYGASEVTLVRRQHRMLVPIELLEDRMLPDDRATYRDLPEALPLEELPWNRIPSR